MNSWNLLTTAKTFYTLYFRELVFLHIKTNVPKDGDLDRDLHQI